MTITPDPIMTTLSAPLSTGARALFLSDLAAGG